MGDKGWKGLCMCNLPPNWLYFSYGHIDEDTEGGMG